MNGCGPFTGKCEVCGGSGAWVLTNTAGAAVQRSDGNGDGRVTVADLTALQRGRAFGGRVEDIRRDTVTLSAGVDANGGEMNQNIWKMMGGQ